MISVFYMRYAPVGRSPEQLITVIKRICESPSDVQKENTCPTRCCICRRGGAAAARRRRPACGLRSRSTCRRTATGVRVRSRGRRVDVLAAARARADALVAHGATCSACSGFCPGVVLSMHVLAVLHDRHVRRGLGRVHPRCRRSQRAALARPAALCERRVPPRATVWCV